jgi:hypothetical protein
MTRFKFFSNHASRRGEPVIRTLTSCSYGFERKMGTLSIKAKGMKGKKSFAARSFSSHIMPYL